VWAVSCSSKGPPYTRSFLATALAVIVGTLLVFGVGWLVGRLAVRRRHTV
jgi:hypothetical protein